MYYFILIFGSANESYVSKVKVAAPKPRPTAQELRQKEIELILEQQKKLAEELSSKNKEEKRKADAIKLKTEAHERTKQLLEKQMNQLKVLLAKLDTSKEAMKVCMLLFI